MYISIYIRVLEILAICNVGAPAYRVFIISIHPPKKIVQLSTFHVNKKPKTWQDFNLLILRQYQQQPPTDNITCIMLS